MSFLRRHRWTIRLSVLMVVVLAFMYSLEREASAWTFAGSVFLSIRLAVYAVCYYCFDQTLGPVLQRATRDDDFVERVRANRLRISIWILVIEGIFYLSVIGIY